MNDKELERLYALGKNLGFSRSEVEEEIESSERVRRKSVLRAEIEKSLAKEEG